MNVCMHVCIYIYVFFISYFYVRIKNYPDPGYVDAAQYIPVQQQPRPVQLQISLPPNMNPLQTRPR